MSWDPMPDLELAAAGGHPQAHRHPSVRYAEWIALVDLLDRVLAGGVVVAGDVRLCIAGVDLVRISLRALVASVTAIAEASAVSGASGRTE